MLVTTKDSQQPVAQAVQQPATPDLQANDHLINETKSRQTKVNSLLVNQLINPTIFEEAMVALQSIAGNMATLAQQGEDDRFKQAIVIFCLGVTPQGSLVAPWMGQPR